VSSTSTFLLFVYGTLKRDGQRHGQLALQRFLGTRSTRPLYALLDLGPYPGLVLSPDNGQAIEGELFEVDQALRPWLDDVEGAPDLYHLGPVEIDGVAEEVQTYFYQGSALGWPRCPAGRWNNHP
jgi:gamma-glutamylaminecyclotransferase